MLSNQPDESYFLAERGRRNMKERKQWWGNDSKGHNSAEQMQWQRQHVDEAVGYE